MRAAVVFGLLLSNMINWSSCLEHVVSPSVACGASVWVEPQGCSRSYLAALGSIYDRHANRTGIHRRKPVRTIEVTMCDTGLVYALIFAAVAGQSSEAF